MTALLSNPEARLARLELSLEGLSLGDAFGERFFGPPGVMQARIAERQLPQAPWNYTDDTEMALGLREVLAAHHAVEADALADVFARRFRQNRYRGYGATAQQILEAIGDGVGWQVVARRPFGGEGSQGNGAAMRVAPLGAYFADEPERVAAEAVRSAEVTHAHPDGQAGAVAVALAAAWAAQHPEPSANEGEALLLWVGERTPAGATQRGLLAAADIDPKMAPEVVAASLGSGQRVISSDTVPFALWCAAHHLRDFEDAMWTTVAGLGDRDTTCAIAGGVVALGVGRARLPPSWLAARERLGIAPSR